MSNERIGYLVKWGLFFLVMQAGPCIAFALCAIVFGLALDWISGASRTDAAWPFMALTAASGVIASQIADRRLGARPK